MEARFACSRSLGLGFLLLDLDQVAACVVEDCGDYWPEVCWRLYELHTFCLETLVFGLHVVDREGGAGDSRPRQAPSRTDGPRDGHQAQAGTPSPSGSSGDTTVIQAYSPKGMLCLSWKPSVSV